jgi:hypothetical protein
MLAPSYGDQNFFYICSFGNLSPFLFCLLTLVGAYILTPSFWEPKFQLWRTSYLSFEWRNFTPFLV